MKILIAEDDAVSRRLLRGCLEKFNHEVTEAVNGAEALRRFEEAEFPVVISDWMMPEMDGIELTRRIRAKNLTRYVYIILLTAKSQKEDLIQGMEAGADDFLTKPFDRDELRVRLSAAERVLRLEHTLAEQNQQLREAQAALVQSEKFVSIGQLAMGVANEISSPIAELGDTLALLRRNFLRSTGLLTIYRDNCRSFTAQNPSLAAEIAAEEKELDVDHLSFRVGAMLDRSLTGMNRVRETVRNLRDFAHLDEYLTKEFSIDAAVEDVLTLVERELLRKRIDVQQHCDPLPPIEGNPGKIKKVLLNIILRGIEASPRDGTLQIRIKPWTDGGAIVEIQDGGAGIAADDLKHLFEPFYPLRLHHGQGNGLGLSISFNIVKEHGGNIEVTSLVGQNTTFRIFLPAKSKASGSAKTAEAEAAVKSV